MRVTKISQSQWKMSPFRRMTAEEEKAEQESDEKRQGRITKEVADALTKHIPWISRSDHVRIVDAITRGDIPHLTITC